MTFASAVSPGLKSKTVAPNISVNQQACQDGYVLQVCSVRVARAWQVAFGHGRDGQTIRPLYSAKLTAITPFTMR